MCRVGNRENFIEPAAFDRKEIERKVDKRIEFVGELRNFIHEKENLPNEEFSLAVKNFISAERQKDYFQDQPWQEKIDIFSKNFSVAVDEAQNWRKLYEKGSLPFFQEIAKIVKKNSDLAKKLQKEAKVEFNGYSVTIFIPDSLYRRMIDSFSVGKSGFGKQAGVINFVLDDSEKNFDQGAAARHEKNHVLIFLFEQFYKEGINLDKAFSNYVIEELQARFSERDMLLLLDERKEKGNYLPFSLEEKMQMIYDGFLDNVIKAVSKEYFSEILAEFYSGNDDCLRNFRACLRKNFFSDFSQKAIKNFLKNGWEEYFRSLKYFYLLSEDDEREIEGTKQEIFNFIDKKDFNNKETKIKEKLKPLAKKELILDDYFFIASKSGKLELWQNALIFFGPNKLKRAQSYLQRKVSPEEFIFWKWCFSLILKKDLKNFKSKPKDDHLLKNNFLLGISYGMATSKVAEEVTEADLTKENFLKAINFFKKLPSAKKQEIFQKAPFLKKDILQKYYPAQKAKIKEIFS